MSKTNKMYLVTGAIPEEEKGSIRECEGSIPLNPERIKGCYSLQRYLRKKSKRQEKSRL